MSIPLTIPVSPQINYSYVGLVLCIISFALVWGYGRRKQWEECIASFGVGMVGFLLFFTEEVAEVVTTIGGPISLP